METCTRSSSDNAVLSYGEAQPLRIAFWCQDIIRISCTRGMMNLKWLCTAALLQRLAWSTKTHASPGAWAGRESPYVYAPDHTQSNISRWSQSIRRLGISEPNGRLGEGTLLRLHRCKGLESQLGLYFWGFLAETQSIFAGYFDAPGADMAPLKPLQSATPFLPDTTLVFCCIENFKEMKVGPHSPPTQLFQLLKGWSPDFQPGIFKSKCQSNPFCCPSAYPFLYSLQAFAQQDFFYSKAIPR